MAKKKQPDAPKTPVEIDTAAALTRDEYGYGALPGIDHDAETMAITPAQGEALIQQLAKQGMQTMVVSLRELPGDGVEGAQKALEELGLDDSVSAWEPSPPEGNGWSLVAVLYHQFKDHIKDDEADAVAIWARPQSAASDDAGAPFDDQDTQDRAAMFLIGNLMKAAKRRFVDLAVPWKQLSEQEQERTLRNLADDVKSAVRVAIRAIASNERITFRAEVESVNFKGATDVKAVLKMVSGNEAHSLADVAGGFVTVVIENTDDLLDIPQEATTGDADQKPLFDKSTEGTALDTKPEEVAA